MWLLTIPNKGTLQSNKLQPSWFRRGERAALYKEVIQATPGKDMEEADFVLFRSETGSVIRNLYKYRTFVYKYAANTKR